MKRYASKSEVLHVLEQGGHAESHEQQQWLVNQAGEYQGGIRYSLWNILYTKGTIKKIRKEMRPPSRLPFHIWTLNNPPPPL